jgi:hypothetical protein
MSIILRILTSTLLVALATSLVHLTHVNLVVRHELTEALDAIAAGKGACVLPPLISETAASTVYTLSFPRERPVLVLASRRDCPYCESSLRHWRGIIDRFTEMDGIIYDPTTSYSLKELDLGGVPAASVLTTRSAPEPYQSLLSKTPVLMLVGRSGRVLAVWTGELSSERVRLIQSSIQNLLN